MAASSRTFSHAYSPLEQQPSSQLNEVDADASTAASSSSPSLGGLVKRALVMLAVSLVVVVAVVAVLTTTSSSSSAVGSGPLSFLRPGQPSSSTADDTSLVFTLNRQNYPILTTFSESKSKFLNYKFLADYGAIIEPYAPMQVYMLGDADMTARNYKFTICEMDSDGTVTDTCKSATKYADEDSETVTFDCTPQTDYQVKVVESGTYRTGTILAKCLYIRRDIEQLTEDDLAATMDAMHALWVYTEEEGRELYGDDFHSSVFFAEAHHFNSAWLDADHIHEGLGFLPQHIKLVNYLEASMQSVDPSVTLPYWEFTRELTQNKTVFDSIMFTDKTFGTLTRPMDSRWGFMYKSDSVLDGAIPDGRWAYLKTELNTRYDLPAGYGYLRAPWSMNPSPYVSRFAAETPGLPTCKSYYSLLGIDGFMTFLDNIQKDPHSSLHQVIGNVFGCDMFDELREKGIILDEDSSQIGLCKGWSYYMKDLYRNTYILPEQGCSSDDDCGYVCADDKLDDIKTFLKSLINKRFLSSELSDSDWDTVRDFVCEGNGAKVLIGTHMESSSSSDPSFWPAHPTQERLLHAKMMASVIESWTWPKDQTKNYVCDIPQCYVNYDDSKDYYDSCCYGHFEYDRLLDFVNGTRLSTYGVTNHEVLLATNPISEDYSMPYIYDEFDWSHCEEDIAGLLAKLNKVALSDDSPPKPGKKAETPEK